MKINIVKKLYLYLHMKICKILNINFIKEYTTVFKYKNKVGYFNHVPALNKRDARKKVRNIIIYSNFFNEVINNKNDIKIIVIKEDDIFE